MPHRARRHARPSRAPRVGNAPDLFVVREGGLAWSKYERSQREPWPDLDRRRCPRSNCRIGRHHQERDRRAQAGAHGRQVARPRVELVGIDPELNLDHEAEHRLAVRAAKVEHEIGATLGWRDLTEIALDRSDAGELGQLEPKRGTRELRRQRRPIAEECDERLVKERRHRSGSTRAALELRAPKIKAAIRGFRIAA